MQSNRYLSAIKEGFFGSTPLLIAGSIFLLFTSLPFDWYSAFLADNPAVMDFFYIPYQMTFNVMTIFVIVGIARSLSNYYKVDSKIAICLSFVALFLLTPLYRTDDFGKVLPITNFAAQGLFVGIICSICSVELYRFCVQKNLTIKMPDSVPTDTFFLLSPPFLFLPYNTVRCILQFLLFAHENAPFSFKTTAPNKEPPTGYPINRFP